MDRPAENMTERLSCWTSFHHECLVGAFLWRLRYDRPPGQLRGLIHQECHMTQACGCENDRIASHSFALGFVYQLAITFFQRNIH